MGVLRGGNFLKDCWESVRPFSNCFDAIIVSLNPSDQFEDDLMYLAQNKVSNLTIIHPSKYLGPVEHFLFILKYVKSQWIFLFSHDDMLVGENLLKEMAWLRSTLKQGSTSVFGNYVLIDETGKELGTVDELGGATMPIHRFIRYDLTKNWYTNVSGMLLNTTWLKQNQHIVRRFKKGIRQDYLWLTLPNTSFICSPQLPIVKIRLHPGQEGRQPYKLARASDEMLYWLLQSMWRDGQSREDSIHKVATMLINKKPFLYWYYFAKHAIGLGVPIGPILRSCKQRLYQVLKSKMPI